MKENFIPEKLYKRIIKNLPICCVDVVVVNKDRFLLVQRKKYPARGKWWFSGGRLLFNESLKTGVKRKLKEELGIKKTKKIKFLEIGETKFTKGNFDFPVHSINITFMAEIDDFQEKNVNLDIDNHIKYEWFKKIPKKVDPYIKRFLKLAGFK